MKGDHPVTETNELTLSIGVLAYNHEKYIASALDSILMQQVSFNYEIVVGEDCSNDKTREILIDYKARYPEKIKLILHEHNLGINGNANAVRFACKGKYMAFLDGDNYWTDPLKLQKQVDFLEKHPEFIGHAHKVEVVNAEGKPSKERYYAYHCPDSVFTLAHAEKGMLPGQSGTYLFRNIFLNFTDFQKELYYNCDSVGDSKLVLCLSLNGDIYCSDEIMSAFRLVTDGNSFSSKSYRENLSLEYCHWLEERIRLAKECFGREVSYHDMLLDIGYHAFVAFIRYPNSKNFSIFRKVMTYQTRSLMVAMHIFRKCLLLPFRVFSRLIKRIGLNDIIKKEKKL